MKCMKLQQGHRVYSFPPTPATLGQFLRQFEGEKSARSPMWRQNFDRIQLRPWPKNIHRGKPFRPCSLVWDLEAKKSTYLPSKIDSEMKNHQKKCHFSGFHGFPTLPPFCFTERPDPPQGTKDSNLLDAACRVWSDRQAPYVFFVNLGPSFLPTFGIPSGYLT